MNKNLDFHIDKEDKDRIFQFGIELLESNTNYESSQLFLFLVFYFKNVFEDSIDKGLKEELKSNLESSLYLNEEFDEVINLGLKKLSSSFISFKLFSFNQSNLDDFEKGEFVRLFDGRRRNPARKSDFIKLITVIHIWDIAGELSRSKRRQILQNTLVGFIGIDFSFSKGIFGKQNDKYFNSQETFYDGGLLFRTIEELCDIKKKKNIYTSYSTPFFSSRFFKPNLNYQTNIRGQKYGIEFFISKYIFELQNEEFYKIYNNHGHKIPTKGKDLIILNEPPGFKKSLDFFSDLLPQISEISKENADIFILVPERQVSRIFRKNLSSLNGLKTVIRFGSHKKNTNPRNLSRYIFSLSTPSMNGILLHLQKGYQSSVKLINLEEFEFSEPSYDSYGRDLKSLIQNKNNIESNSSKERITKFISNTFSLEDLDEENYCLGITKFLFKTNNTVSLKEILTQIRIDDAQLIDFDEDVDKFLNLAPISSVKKYSDLKIFKQAEPLEEKDYNFFKNKIRLIKAYEIPENTLIIGNKSSFSGSFSLRYASNKCYKIRENKYGFPFKGFKVNTKKVLIDFLIIELSKEYVRYQNKFILSHNDFQEIKIHLPDLNEQKSTVKAYNNIVNSIEDFSGENILLREKNKAQSEIWDDLQHSFKLPYSELKNAIDIFMNTIKDNKELNEKFIEKDGISLNELLNLINRKLDTLDETVTRYKKKASQNFDDIKNIPVNILLSILNDLASSYNIKPNLKFEVRNEFFQNSYPEREDLVSYDSEQGILKLSDEIKIRSNENIFRDLINNIYNNTEKYGFKDVHEENHILCMVDILKESDNVEYMCLSIGHNGDNLPESFNKNWFIRSYKGSKSKDGVGSGGSYIHQSASLLGNKNWNMILKEKDENDKYDYPLIYEFKFPINYE